MDHKTAVETLVKIEDRAHVNGLLYHGVMIWPILRLQLWKRLLHLSSARVDEKETLQYPKPIRRRVSPWKQLRRLLAEQAQWSALRKHQSEFLFFSNPKHYRFEMMGKPYNYLLDPWFEVAQKDHRCLKVEISRGASRPPFIPALVLEEYFPASFSSSPRIEGLPDLNASLNELGLPIQLADDELVPLLSSMESQTTYYKKILSCVRPSAVFLVNYYGESNLPLVRACRNLGAKIIDVQHGKQGRYHGMYNHWTRIPEHGYEFLPDFFWVWGEESGSNILQGRSLGGPQHLPVVGGNLWLLKWKDDQWYVESQEEQRFGTMLREKQRVIVYSAQPIDQPFPGHVLEAMKNSPPGWLWLVRLHPKQIANTAEIVDFLRAAGVSQFEVEQATRLPLYSLIKKSHYHITCWSTVCYEALVFGVPTSIVHNNGKSLYEDYITKGIFSYAESAQELLEQIEHYKTTSSRCETSPYLIADRDVAEKALNIILQT